MQIENQYTHEKQANKNELNCYKNNLLKRKKKSKILN